MPSRKFRVVAHEIHERRMALLACGQQGAMDQLGAVVSQRLARRRGERAASFVHQKVSSCKVPVVTVTAGESDIEDALRDTRESQRNRADARYRHGVGVEAGKPIDVTL